MHEWLLIIKGKVNNPTGIPATPVSTYDYILYFKYCSYDANFLSTVKAESTFTDINYTVGNYRLDFTEAEGIRILNGRTNIFFEETTGLNKLILSSSDVNHISTNIKFIGATNLVHYSETSTRAATAAQKASTSSPYHNIRNKSYRSNGANLYWHYILEYRFNQYGYPSIYSDPFIFKAGTKRPAVLGFRYSITAQRSSTDTNELELLGDSLRTTAEGQTIFHYHEDSYWGWENIDSRGSVVPDRDIQSVHIGITKNSDRLVESAFRIDSSRWPEMNVPAGQNWDNIDDALFFSGNIYQVTTGTTITITSEHFASLSGTTTFYMFLLLILNEQTYSHNQQINTNTVPRFSAYNIIHGNNTDLNIATTHHYNQNLHYVISTNVVILNPPTIVLNYQIIARYQTMLEFTVGNSATYAVQYANNDASEWTKITFASGDTGFGADKEFTRAEVTSTSDKCSLTGLTSGTTYNITVTLTYAGFTNPSDSIPVATHKTPPTVTLHDLSSTSGTRNSITISSSDYTVTNNDYTPTSFTINMFSRVNGGYITSIVKSGAVSNFTFSSLTPYTTYYFNMSIYSGSRISHPDAGFYKPRSTSGTAPTVSITTTTSSYSITPSTDTTWNNGDAGGDWTKMTLDVWHVFYVGGYHQRLEKREVTFANRTSPVTFTNDIRLRGHGYNNRIYVHLHYTNPLVPAVRITKYITSTGSIVDSQ